MIEGMYQSVSYFCGGGFVLSKATIKIHLPIKKILATALHLTKVIYYSNNEKALGFGDEAPPLTLFGNLADIAIKLFLAPVFAFEGSLILSITITLIVDEACCSPSDS